jgi:hypothetical protein
MTPRRLVVEALTAGVEAGDDAAAQAVLAHADPVLRLAARGRLSKAWQDAMIVGGDVGLGSSADSTRHLLRVASLRQRGRTDVDFTDPAQVAEAYASSSPPSPRRRRPWASLSLIALVLCGVAVAALLYVRAQRPRLSQALLRRLMTPPSAGAFAAGGAPLEDPLLERVFKDDLPDLVVMLDRELNGRAADLAARDALLARLTAPEVLARLGPLAAERWRHLLDTYVELAGLDPEDEAFRNAGMRLLDAAGLFDDQLAARGLAYYVDGDVYGNDRAWHAILYSHRVDDVVLVRRGEVARRVLTLRRLDTLSVAPGLLGMRAEHLRDPLVLLDQIEEHVTELVLPALGEGEPMPLGDDRWNATADGQAVAARAGALAREELALAVAPDGARMRRVGTLMAERARLWASWSRTLALDGIQLTTLDMIYLPEGALDSLDERIERHELTRMAELEQALHDEDAEGAAARLVRAIARSVGRHEAQHAFDADEPLPYPAVLVRLAGPELDEEGEVRRRARAASAELSAYLAQLASDPLIARLELALLSRYLFDSDRWGGTECIVALVVLEELSTRLGVAQGPLLVDGTIDRERAAAAFLAVTAQPTAAVQSAAAAAWSTAFGRPFVLLR